MKKKSLLIVSCVLMIAALTVGASLAYFTDTDSADNSFTVGNVTIDLTEPGWEGGGSEDAPEVYPGEALTKDPQVTNVGANPCFVRISVTGLDSLGEAGLIRYRTGYVLDALGENWVLLEDGYFYYQGVLEVGDTTSALFDSIVIPTGLENGDPSVVHAVTVQAQAVQAQGARPSYADVQTMTAAEIAQWFAVTMS